MDELLNEFSDTGLLNKVMCKRCNKMLNSSRSFNLKSHLKNSHQLEIVTSNKNIRKVDKKSKVIKTKLEINKIEIIRSYVGLVTENGMPFDLLNSANMRNILKPISNALNCANEKMFEFNSENAKKILGEVVIKLREQIKSELKNTLFSIKIDSATRLERCIFGISVQYCKDSKIVSRVIGMVELKNRGTSKNLCSEILKTLNKYELNIQQVIAITSDNGANMIKATSLLSHCIAANNDDDQILSNEDYEKLLNEITSDADLSLGEITICRCAAHTAQLVALDVIKNETIKSFIIQCRNVIKFVRKPTNGFRALFEINGIHVPKIDCPTRWGSTYNMIEDLKTSKSILGTSQISSRPEFFGIDEQFWNNVDTFLLTFAPLNDILVKFQAESLHYGDFYAHWLKCKLLIKKNFEERIDGSFGSMLCESLIKSIEKRSEKLLENEILKASIYLDPRFQHTQTIEEKEIAISFLKKIWDRYILINKEYDINIESIPPEQSIDDEDDILTAFLKQDIMEEHQVTTNTHTKIELLKLPFLKSTTNVLNYWLDRRATDPELYILSNIIFGVPPTQVTVERAFSALRIILTDNRNRLSEENLENILLAKLNKSLLDNVIEDIIV